MTFDSVIWDWNGTLLNDRDLALTTINQLLGQRGLPTISLEHYLEVFTFPVQEYYEEIGFDLRKEPFEIPASQFIDRYTIGVTKCTLHDQANVVLRRIQASGRRQFILSAMEQSQLEKTVADTDIRVHFEELCGLDNHFATSKIENGIRLILAKGLNPKRTIMIGDTVHDYEAAQAMGCQCILIANGHQSKKRLVNTGAPTLDNLSQFSF